MNFRHPRLLFLTVTLTTLFALAAACTSSSEPTQTPAATSAPTTTATQTPTASPSGGTVFPSATPVSQAPGDALFGIIPVPPDRDLYELARRLTLKMTQPVPRHASPLPVALTEGQELTWRVSRDSGMVTVNAEVRHVSENAYWVFEDAYAPDQGRLEEAARHFESAVWPGITDALGDVWTPGVDGDPRVVIFHGQLRSGVAGYFSGIDEYPVQIQPDSNQREVIYISANAITLGGNAYFSTLAHELQHAVHWAADAGEESWVNEGISEVASRLAGYPPGSVNSFLTRPNTSLLQWEPEIFQASPNYGAAALFFEYISTRYGGTDTLRAIVRHQADGIDSVEAALNELGHGVKVSSLFADWVVANYVDDSSGDFAYPDRQLTRPRSTFINAPETISETVRPFGTNYYTLQDPGDQVTVDFQGQRTGQVFPAEPRSGNSCWWTNAGDSIDTTLTRSVDLRNVDSARFEFWAWYAIEEDWDYAYVEVSTDGGSTWQILATDRSLTSNPNGTSFGPGITGLSRAWVKDGVDISQYAGEEILLRIEYITDDAIHDRGACFDDFAIEAIGWSDSTESSSGWQSEGFALINDRIEVDYLVQVIREGQGGQSTVEQLVVGGNASGQVTVSGPQSGEQLAVAVSVLTADLTGSVEYAINFTSQ